MTGETVIRQIITLCLLGLWMASSSVWAEGMGEMYGKFRPLKQPAKPSSTASQARRYSGSSGYRKPDLGAPSSGYTLPDYSSNGGAIVPKGRFVMPPYQSVQGGKFRLSKPGNGNTPAPNVTRQERAIIPYQMVPSSGVRQPDYRFRPLQGDH
ncbi:hypothetical protein [Sedimenticola sp.]|uniref:hypothetical protein n=1 Tax=Sedimenticola sp. TaxID=1940285 RepID=UPI003D0CA72F